MTSCFCFLEDKIIFLFLCSCICSKHVHWNRGVREPRQRTSSENHGVTNVHPQIFPFSPSTKVKTMGCVKSKQDKGAATKYHTDSTPVSDANAAAAKPHAGHYGPEPTQLLQNHPGSAAPGAANFNHSLTPFGGSSSVMTPFGGMSCSFSGPVSNSFSGAVSSELSRYIESGGCGADSRCGCFVCRPPTERRLTCESKNIGRFLS